MAAGFGGQDTFHFVSSTGRPKFNLNFTAVYTVGVIGQQFEAE